MATLKPTVKTKLKTGMYHQHFAEAAVEICKYRALKVANER